MLNFLKRIREEKEEIKSLHEEQERLVLEIKQLTQKRYDVITDTNNALEKLRLIEAGFNNLEEVNYQRYVPTMQSDDIEKKLYGFEIKLAEMVARDDIIILTREYRIDGSEAKGRKFQNTFGKNLLIGFNAYVKAKTKALTRNNYSKTVELIKKSFVKYDKQGQLLGISLNGDYLDLTLEILHCTIELKIKKDTEKAELRRERQRMREQERLLKEARKEKEKLEAQRKAEDIAYAKALTEKERAQIKANIDALDKRINDIDYRVNNPKAGWVYIIHSPSLPDMVKIGVSRRLNGPYERVAELSSSSLPFPFILDGFCFSDDSFAIESAMHEYFDKQRVSANREFFYITADKAIQVLKNHFHQEVLLGSVEKENKEN